MLVALPLERIVAASRGRARLAPKLARTFKTRVELQASWSDETVEQVLVDHVAGELRDLVPYVAADIDRGVVELRSVFSTESVGPNGERVFELLVHIA